MIPCYQICKDRRCPHWEERMLECDRLPSTCEYAVEHLVSDRGNQLLDGKQHGFWQLFYGNGQLMYEGNYVNGMQDGSWRGCHDNGKLWFEDNYVKGEFSGRKRWTVSGELIE